MRTRPHRLWEVLTDEEHNADRYKELLLDTTVLTLSFLQYGYMIYCLFDDNGPSILKGGRPSNRHGILDRLRRRSFFVPSS